MRQLIIQTPRGRGQEALEAALDHKAGNAFQFQAQADGGPVDLVFAAVPNAGIESLLDRLQRVPDLHVTFAPQGVLPLRPPAGEAPDQVTDVGHRSPVEIFLGGLQSVGSWRGFLGYAAASGLVAWLGLFTNTIYLLTAAMLIAPFASPAMNLALATARGDSVLIGRSVGRYFGSLATSIAVAWTFSLLMGLETATAMMVETSLNSSAAVVLPLVAGAAGALNLAQSERDSLVTAAGTGVLVAASLAPPAALVGMAGALGDWPMVKAALFVLLLQLLGINVAGAIVFRLFGVSPRGPRFRRGHARWAWTSWAATALGLGIVLFWQFSTFPELRQSTVAQRAVVTIERTVEASGLARYVQADTRFTRSGPPDENRLLAQVWVEGRLDTGDAGPELEARIQQALRARFTDVTPLVDVTVLTE